MPKRFDHILKINQSGYMWYFLTVAIVFLLLFFTKLNVTPLPKPVETATNNFCREMVNDPDAPIVDRPVYSTTSVDTSQTTKYKMLKKNVPVPYYFLAAENNKQHFFNSYAEVYTDPSSGKKYLKKVPNGENGQSYKLPSDVGPENYLIFADYGLLFLFHLDENEKPTIFDRFEISPGNFMEVHVTDIYKAIDKPDLPEWVLKCHDAGTNGTIDNVVFKKDGIYSPPQSPSTDKEELQLEYFLLQKYTLLLQAWWTPHCKPAVYLYPPKAQMVNVKVKPNGFLTYMDPNYNSSIGWTVLANPDGTLINSSADSDNQKKYDYLYFESKINDRAITKPEKGWVVEYKNLESFYQQILPTLGFNQKQSTDFIQFWKKSLPDSPYYFVSLVHPQEIENYESLEIEPNPDFIKRVRFYFEPRTAFSQVEPIDIATFYPQSAENTGFRVFEWGGMFKRDKNHNFTCAM